MQNLLTESNHNPDTIWGIEAMDSWTCFDWIRTLYQKEFDSVNNVGPMVLLYRPPVERTALRCLQWFSRFGRAEDGTTVSIYGERQRPFIHFTGDDEQSHLLLIHHASRFLDLSQLLQRNRENKQLRLVLTMPEDEAEFIRFGDNARFERLPAFEKTFNDEKGHELIIHFLGETEKAPPRLDLMLQIMAETGQAGVQIPLLALANYLHVDCRKLYDAMLCEPLSGFIHMIERCQLQSINLQFRGRWLAELVQIEVAENESFPHLSALVHYLDMNTEGDRACLLNVLVGLWFRWSGSTRFRAFVATHSEKITTCLDAWHTMYLNIANQNDLNREHPFLQAFHQVWQEVKTTQNQIENRYTGKQE